jgi:ribonuclease BN (tRNA processing enzyme)
MATPDTQRLEVHVFGAGEGESIIVQTPGGEWGVVDCFASSLTDPTTNAAYQFLEGQGVEEIQFLCMTHPHRDHFRGMSQLLDRFKIRSFWRPAVLSGKRLEWLLESVRRDATKSGADKFLKDSEELFRIFSLVKEKKQTTGKPAIPRHAATGMQLLSSDSGAGNFEIWALAPSGRQIERYEDELSACFDADNRFVRAAANSSHNIASMALLIVFGETRIVLGGDVERFGWQDVLSEFDANQLSCHLVSNSRTVCLLGDFGAQSGVRMVLLGRWGWCDWL